jgi:Mn-dependent DtxR family transcriptional regulator
MSEHPILSPDEVTRRAQQIREAMSRMSVDELCDLLRDLQKKMREVASSPGTRHR